MKAKQNDTPNAYVKDASSREDVRALIGRNVAFEVKSEGIELRAATLQEVEEHLNAIRPSSPQTPLRDLTRGVIARLSEIRHSDARAYGAKTANLGELRRILPPGTVPDGFGVPYSFYHRFMMDTGLYRKAYEMTRAPDFETNPEIREKCLRELRKSIKSADVPGYIERKLQVLHDDLQLLFGSDVSPRCRSVRPAPTPF